MLLEAGMGRIVTLMVGVVVVMAVGCGSGTLGGGPDGGGDPNSAACSSLTACGCLAAGGRCALRTEACYCPSECDPSIACICGGGQFLACEDAIIHPTPPTCLLQAQRVQQQCAAQPFVNYVDDLCRTQTDPCVTSCLANLASCSDIDCRFCPICDCDPPDRANAFAACIEGCGPLR